MNPYDYNSAPTPDLDRCSCGSCRWNRSTDDPRCRDCGCGPMIEKKREYKLVVARKDYPEQGIKKGDRYSRVTVMGYYPYGPRFLKVTRSPLRKW